MAEGVRLFTGSTARGGFLAGMDQAVISLANFVAALLLARAVSPTEFGSYAVAFLGLHLVRALIEGAIIQPVSSLGPGMGEREYRIYISQAAAIQGAAAVAVAAAAAVLGSALTAAGNDVAGPTVFGLWFPSLAWSLNEFLRRAFYARGRVRQALANTVFASLARIGALLILLAAGSRSGQIGMQAIGWGGVGGTILGVVQTRRLWSFPGAGRIPVWEQHVAMARWLVPGSLGNWIAAEVYPLLTAGLVSFAAAGAYRALLTVIAPVHVYLRALDTYFAPRVAGAYDAGGRRALASSLRRLYLLALLPVSAVTLSAALWPGGLLRLFYGETYVAYSAGLPLMGAAYLLWGFYAPLHLVFRAARMTRPIFLANSAATLAMFTVGVWAILRWGLYGAIGGQVLNAALTGLILAASWKSWWKQGTERDSAARGAA